MGPLSSHFGISGDVLRHLRDKAPLVATVFVVVVGEVHERSATGRSQDSFIRQLRHYSRNCLDRQSEVVGNVKPRHRLDEALDRRWLGLR